MGAQNEQLLGIGNEEYIVVIRAGPHESPDDYMPESTTRHTHIIASHDYEQFTFISRIRRRQESKRGDVRYKKFAFGKEVFREGMENETQILKNINAMQYQSSTPPIERFRNGSKRALSYVRNLI